MNCKSFMRFVVGLAAITLAVGASQAEKVTRLARRGAPGGKVAYELNETPKITFGDDAVTIALGEESRVEVPMASLSHFSYETVETGSSGVDQVEGSAEGSAMVGGNLVYTLTEGDNSIEIVDAQGCVLVAKTLRGAGERVYPLTGLAPRRADPRLYPCGSRQESLRVPGHRRALGKTT